MYLQEEPFEKFNKLVKETMKYPVLKSQELDELFYEIEQHLKESIYLILQVSTFIEGNICYQLAGLSIGAVKHKIFRGKWSNQKTRLEGGVEVSAKNLKLLEKGFDLFKLSRTRRDIALPLVLRVLRSLRLSNHTYEQICIAFIQESEEYIDVIDELTELSEELSQQESPDVKQMQKVSDLIDKKEQIEEILSVVDPKYLYGVVARVRYLMKKIKRKQEKVIKSYLRLVPSVVKESARSDLTAMDLFQFGSLGLAHAVSVYDRKARTAFPSFAKPWIRQRIEKARKESTGVGPIIRLSSSVWNTYRKIIAAERRMRRLGEKITTEKIAKALDFSEEKVRLTIQSVRNVQAISLDDEVDTSEGVVSRGETVPDEAHEEYLDTSQQQDYIHKLLTTLTDEEKTVVCLHYGLIDEIVNDSLNADEVFHEIYRQLPCKILAIYRQTTAP